MIHRHDVPRRAMRFALIVTGIALYGAFAVAATLLAFWLTFA